MFKKRKRKGKQSRRNYSSKDAEDADVKSGNDESATVVDAGRR